MTPKEWIEKLKTTAPHLFRGSNGGGAAGNTNSSGASGGDAKFGGMSREEFLKLSPEAKLQLAHRQKNARSGGFGARR